MTDGTKFDSLNGPSTKFDSVLSRGNFDTVEIAPTANNYGTVTNQTRPTLMEFNLNSAFNEDSISKPTTPLNKPINNNNDENITNNNSNSKTNKNKKNNKKNVKKKKFGMFDGVLGRCLLCIWGVIMYLRTGWIVGHSGIWQTTIIMLLAASVTALTSLSLSAICTNGQVKAGGYYFLISRSLGPEFGGVIGILFAFANCISVSMYLTGFAETIVSLYAPYKIWNYDIQLWGCIVLILLLLISLRGVGGVIKFDMVLLAILIISILAYFIGTGTTKENIDKLAFTGYKSSTFKENWNSNYQIYDGKQQNFISVFSVFFPAVTGEMAGANISGDLKDPSYAIPVGTLSAILISTIVYIGIAWSLGATILRGNALDKTSPGLYNDFMIMSKISLLAPYIVVTGIFASTLSSALSCFVGAPRIFQTVCADNLFPKLKFFAKLADNGEPVRAYFIVFVISFLAILTGNINFIAPIITNFFLITYALMNYSCFAWSLTKSPGWRPTFKYYNKYVSLLASIECITLMFVIDYIMALATVFICVAFFLYVKHTDPQVDWGTTAEAMKYMSTCDNIRKYQFIKQNAKVERPTFLIFNINKKIVTNLFDFARCLNVSKGLIIVGDIIVGDHRDPEIIKEFIEKRKHLKYTDIPDIIKKKSVMECVIGNTLIDGIRILLQTAGIGGLRPNVVLFKMQSNLAHKSQSKITKSSSYEIINKVPDWIEGVKDSLNTGSGVVMIKGDIDWEITRKKGTFIDIWWLYDDGGLTVLIPYLLQQNKKFKDCILRVFSLETTSVGDQRSLALLLKRLRINAITVVVTKDGRMIYDDDSKLKTKAKRRKHNPKDFGNASHDEIKVVSAPLKNPNDNHIEIPMSETADTNISTVDGGNDTTNNETKENNDEPEPDDIIDELGTQKIPKGYIDERAKTLQDFGDISEEFANITDIEKLKSGIIDMDIEKDENLSIFAKKKLVKYRKLGKLIEKSRNSELCIVTMPFPRTDYTWYEYLKIIQYLSPKNMPIVFIRGNQDQVLTFAL